MPVIPVKAAGCLIDPPVSVPVAAGAIRAATAALVVLRLLVLVYPLPVTSRLLVSVV